MQDFEVELRDEDEEQTNHTDEDHECESNFNFKEERLSQKTYRTGVSTYVPEMGTNMSTTCRASNYSQMD